MRRLGNSPDQPTRGIAQWAVDADKVACAQEALQLGAWAGGADALDCHREGARHGRQSATCTVAIRGEASLSYPMTVHRAALLTYRWTCVLAFPERGTLMMDETSIMWAEDCDQALCSCPCSVIPGLTKCGRAGFAAHHHAHWMLRHCISHLKTLQYLQEGRMEGRV